MYRVAALFVDGIKDAVFGSVVNKRASAEADWLAECVAKGYGGESPFIVSRNPVISRTYEDVS